MPDEALILIDIQNDYFEDGLMPLPHINAATAQAAVALDAARRQGQGQGQGMQIIHVQHIAGSDNAPFFRPDTHGSRIHATVSPRASERVVQKARPNSFVGTALEAVLRDAGITRVTLCGAMSQMCVDATARAAADLGFHVTLIADACAAADVTFQDTKVPAHMVHAAIMAPLAASYVQIVAAGEWAQSLG